MIGLRDRLFRGNALLRVTSALLGACLLSAPGYAAGALASKLYGVTGDGGTPPETLFELSKSDASSTLIIALGNGSDGDEIAYNPDDGLIYHASGNPATDTVVFETINPGTLAISPIAVSGYSYNNIVGLTYEGSGVFLAADGNFTTGMYTMTTSGVATFIGSTDTFAAHTGLAYVGATLYAVSRDDALLRVVDPTTAGTVSSQTMTLAGYPITGATALATDPVDDTLWAVLKSSALPSARRRILATVDPGTAVATLVGILDVDGIAGITFVSGQETTVTSSVGSGVGTISPLGAQTVLSGLKTSFTLTPDVNYTIGSVTGSCGGTLTDDTFTTDVITSDCTVIANFVPKPTTRLYAVTGDGGNPPETLFELDMGDASSTFIMTLGNGTVGDEIAFHRDDGLMYHASGTSVQSGTKIFEKIDLDALTVTDIPLSGFNHRQIGGMTYAGSGLFVAGESPSNSMGFLSLTDTGVSTQLGTSEANLFGLAYIGGTLYAVAKDDSLLRVIDPANGSTLSSVPITLPGYTISGATGLATNPDDNSLWALLKFSANQPTDRLLATVDPRTGAASLVGIGDVPGLGGIAFRFEPCTTCEVTPSVSSGNGTITPNTVQSVSYGATQDFSLTPGTGYEVDFVEGTCGGSLAGNVFTISPIWANCTVEAHFAVQTFTLTYAAGTGGSISGTSPQVVDYGADGTEVTAVPDLHYSFDEWSDGVLTPSRTDTNVMADLAVTALFQIDQYTVTSSVGSGNGAISPEGAQLIDWGSTAQFTLTPDTGWHIESVGGTCGGTREGNTYTTNPVTQACTVIANFAIDTFTLTYTAGAGGSIIGVSPQQVDYGASGSEVTANPDANHHFVDWSDGLSTAARTDTNVTSDLSVTANFEIDSYAVTPSVGAGNGAISPSTPQDVDHGSTTQFTLTPDTGWHIDSVGGSCGGTLAGATYTTNPVTGPCTVVANFAIDTYTVTSSVGNGNGAISPLGGQEIEYNQTAQFTLTPDANWHIDSVGGSCGGSLVDDTYTTDPVTAPCTVIANFAIDTNTVSSSVGNGNGSISPSGDQEVDYGDTAQFTLTPDTGWQIDTVGGTCGGTLVGDTYTTDPVTAPCTVVANFLINSYTVTPSVEAGTGTITPSDPQEIEHESTAQFTLTPAGGFTIGSVGGTCGGTLEGEIYTTNPVVADCTVTVRFQSLTDHIFGDSFESN